MIVVRPDPKIIGPPETWSSMTVEGIRELIPSAIAGGHTHVHAMALYMLAAHLDNNIKSEFRCDNVRFSRDAILQLTRALALFPLWPESYFNRGIAHMAGEDYLEARVDFTMALALWSCETRFNLQTPYIQMLYGKALLFNAEALSGLGLLDESIVMINEGIALLEKSEHPEAKCWIPQRQQRVDQAIARARKANDA